MEQAFSEKILYCLFVPTWRLQDSQLDQLHHQNLWPSYFPVRGFGQAALKRSCFPSSKEPSDDAPEVRVWWIQEEISDLGCEWKPSGHSLCGQVQRKMALVAPQTDRNRVPCTPGQIWESEFHISLPSPRREMSDFSASWCSHNLQTKLHHRREPRKLLASCCAGPIR